MKSKPTHKTCSARKLSNIPESKVAKLLLSRFLKTRDEILSWFRLTYTLKKEVCACNEYGLVILLWVYVFLHASFISGYSPTTRRLCESSYLSKSLKHPQAVNTTVRSRGVSSLEYGTLSRTVVSGAEFTLSETEHSSKSSDGRSRQW